MQGRTAVLWPFHQTYTAFFICITVTRFEALPRSPRLSSHPRLHAFVTFFGCLCKPTKLNYIAFVWLYVLRLWLTVALLD